MARSSLRIHPAEDAGYVVAYALADVNLRDGRSVIADSVDAIELARRAWADVADNPSMPNLDVEVICSDATEHRRRVEARAADLEGHKLLGWADVLRRTYEPWQRERLVIDTYRNSVDEAVECIACRAYELRCRA